MAQTPVTKRNISRMTLEEIQAGILGRLIEYPYERCHVLFVLEPHDFSSSEAIRLYAYIMELPASRTACAAGELAAELERHADSAVMEYLIQVASHGRPFSLVDLLACTARIHNLGLLRNRDNEYGELAAEAFLEDLQASSEYDPSEIDWPDCDE